MNNISINKHFILISLIVLVLIGYFAFADTPNLNLEKSWIKPNAGENVSNPILLGSPMPIVSEHIHAAQRGVMKPLGGHCDPIAHIQGDHSSVYTAWLPLDISSGTFDENLIFLHYVATTTESAEACEGYILIKEISPSSNNILNMSIYYNTNIMLVEGIVTECKIIPVSPETSLEELKILILSNY